MSPSHSRHVLEVLEPGPLTLVQDAGRRGYASLGVARSGPADARSFSLGNRLLGNDERTAALEVTAGRFSFRLDQTSWIAVTGAPTPVSVGGRPEPLNAPLLVRAGQSVALGSPRVGLRSYIAVRGGLEVDKVLGSCSTDTMSGLGPAPLRAGDRLSVGSTPGPWPGVDVAPVAPPPDGVVRLHARPGPHADWFRDEAFAALFGEVFTASSDSNRVGVRLDGPALPRRIKGELSSEGLVTGSLQAPTDGRLTLMLPDHPVTGGYPVIAVLRREDQPSAGQLVPGQEVRFVAAPPAVVPDGDAYGERRSQRPPPEGRASSAPGGEGAQ